MGKKILLIPVGGTICTALNSEGNLSVESGAASLLIENFKKSESSFAKTAEFLVTENLGLLSENLTIESWNLMIKTYLDNISREELCGVIFAHGTDTLAFSAALFSQLLAGTKIPVFFVSANAPLASSRSNGNENFRVAVECILRGIVPNIYVPYKNIKGGQTLIHLASRIRQCEHYSEDFESEGAIELPILSESGFSWVLKKAAELYALQPCSPFKKLSPNLSECVLLIEPYVGINYTAFNIENFRAVLHGAYHSGTANALGGERSILHLLSAANGKTDIFFFPSIPRTGSYETIAIIANAEQNGKKINFLNGCTKETAYAKLLIAYSLLEENERMDFIKTEHNFENAYEGGK